MTLAAFIELIAKIKQKNNGTFKLVDAQDVECEDGKGLDEALNEKLNKNQGAENANKVLGIGADGNVTPIEMSAGVKDYNDLENKPSINGVELKGQLTSEDLGIIAKADNILKGEIKKSLNPSVDDSFKREFWNLKMYGKSTQVTTTGKNKFNIDGNINTLPNGTQGTKNSAENGVLTSNYNTSSEQLAGQLISTESGKQYTISLEVISVGSGSKAYVAIFKNGEPFYTPNISVGIWKTTITATVDEILLAFGTNGGTGAKFTNIQVEEGASQTSYEPYTGGQPSPNPEYKQPITAISQFDGVPTNINLLTNNPSEWTMNSGLYWSAIPNTEISQSRNKYNSNIKLIGIKPNTLYSFKNDNTSELWLDRIIELNSQDLGIINHRLYDNVATSNKSFYSFTTNKDTTALYISVRTIPTSGNIASEDITNEDIENMMISFGIGTLTEYTPYVAQPFTYTPTNPMYSTQDGSICDYVDVEKGVEVYNMIKQILTTENVWTQYTADDSTRPFGKCYTTTLEFPFVNYEVMCDYLPYIQFAWKNATKPSISLSNYGGKVWVLCVVEYETLEEFTQWLSSNLMTIFFQAQAPTEIPIDEEQLAILRKLYSYEGVTNFLCNGEVSCNYEISQQINNEKINKRFEALEAKLLLQGGN